ncbi:MAG: hydroxymethylbilane synthase [Sphingobium sp.]
MTEPLLPPHRPLRLGTRASPLAMAQARLTAQALTAAHGWAADRITIVPVTASGDKVLDRPLADIGGKALWTKELDHWLHDGTIDAAVHSMKDVETIRPETLHIAAMLPRADVRDTLIGAASIEALPDGGRLGTSSPRRAAQIRRLRPDIAPVLFRGNVATRLARLAAGEADATLLATAGLERLGQTQAGTPVPIGQMLPAPAQGAIGIEVLAANSGITTLMAAIDDRDTSDCVHMERAVLAGLGGTCHSPIAALATIEADGGSLLLRAEILAPDGSEHHAESRPLDRADRAGAFALGRALLASASPALRALFTP